MPKVRYSTPIGNFTGGIRELETWEMHYFVDGQRVSERELEAHREAARAVYLAALPSDHWEFDSGVDLGSTKQQILEKMRVNPNWFRFGEMDNIRAVVELLNEGAIALDPDWTNKLTPMFTSIRAKYIQLPEQESSKQ